jgi:hypothetical protein
MSLTISHHGFAISEETGAQNQGAPVKQAQSLVGKLNPRKLGYSPVMCALVGCIINRDYGVRDRCGNRLVGLSITSDGFVIASTDPVSSGAPRNRFRPDSESRSPFV